jgi:CubicO group peptidase (beta-lactamase class C family)
MNKLKIAFAILTLYMAFSCEKKEEAPLLAHYIPEEEPVPAIDSLLITIPLSIEFNPVSEEFKTQKQQKIEAFYRKNIGLADFSGALLVAKNGKILFEDYKGYENFAEKKPINAQSALHLASVSKVLTATLILKLVQENKIALDEKVQTYLPDFPYTQTSVRTLLNHRSGLPHYSRFSEYFKKWNSRKVLTNEDVLQYLKKHKFPLLSKDNRNFNYCNTNYAILALIAEKVTTQSFPEAMKSYVFEPLGMNDSFVIDFETQKKQVSQSYKTNYVNHGWDQFDAIYGDKNIYASLRDMVKFDLATYSETFLRKDLLEEALKGYSYEKRGFNNYGLGYRMKEFDNGETMHYHNGWWHGNTSSYITMKKDTVVIIALSNKYTQKTYRAMRLTALFGDFPFEMDEKE